MSPDISSKDDIRINHTTIPPMQQALIFGEALYDIFPGDKKMLGGAPFNVAWNLAAFGANPVFISRIGDDALGQQILDTMTRAKMETRGIQIDKTHPTGTVSIEMSGGTHQFNINADQAYDYIDEKQALQTAQQTDVGLLYFGTLAIRSERSRQALDQLLELGHPLFVDINLRAPWWTQEIISAALDKATWVKLNEEELHIIITELYALELPLEQAIEFLFSSLNLQALFVTCGENGAYLRNQDELLFSPAPVVESMKDTVGAGDAFTSVSIFGLLNNWDAQTLLTRALSFAADVCAIQGAINSDPSFYQNTSESWR